MRGTRPATAASGRPVLATFALITLMLPVTFNLGTWVMSPSRALFLVLMPIQLFNLMRGQYGKVTCIDWLILGYMAWRTFVPFIHDPRIALQYAGSNSIIFLGGYLAGRATIRSAADFQWMAKVLAAFVIISFPFAVYETITGKFVLPYLFEQIPGVKSVKDVNYMRRMGMDRVQFVFAHPIHYGLFCSLALSVYFVGLRGVISGFRRWAGTLVIIASCVMSVSSGPLLSALAQVGLIFYAHLFRNVERRWLYFGLLFTISYTVIELGSNRPGIVALMSLLTFSASTANVRFILFEYGMTQIAKTPLFGIGFRQWDLPSWMTGSLDNFWLALALIFGLPAFLFLFAAVVTGLVGVGKRAFKPGGELSNARLGWGIMLVSLTLTLATVYVWSEVASLVMFMIGSGVFLLAAHDAPDDESPPPADDNRRSGPAYSRFAPELSRRDATPIARQRAEKGQR
ncbi:MAG: hypothetical protein B7Z02_02290 [Rhodobacterales bacterium 32-67-9]|nr:MAG: hypothetical protein B7Z02_02290 [Rhodobacterales bacterium 32-67-9]